MSSVDHSRLPEDEITNTSLGREVVETFAYGCIEYMLQHDMPLTKEGFEQLVEHSRETGLNGRVAFQMSSWTQNKLQSSFPLSAFGSPMDDERLEKFRKRPSLRNRMLNLGLGEDDNTLEPDQKHELLERFAEYFGGKESIPILRALIVGDCQRDLVFRRIEQIVQQGDVRTQLDRFIGTTVTDDSADIPAKQD